MAYGDRINAIKQDWIDDILEILQRWDGHGKLELKSLSQMSSADLSRLQTILDSKDRHMQTQAVIPSIALPDNGH
jgi:hypothetical protein